MCVPTPRIRVIVSLVLTFMSVDPFALGSSDPTGVEAPSDQELISLFRGHRQEFDRLRQMVTEDMHEQSYFSAATISRISSAPRRLEYQKLLRVRSGLAVGVDYDGGVDRFAMRGSAIGSGWAKGIQYSKTKFKAARRASGNYR